MLFWRDRGYSRLLLLPLLIFVLMMQMSFLVLIDSIADWSQKQELFSQQQAEWGKQLLQRQQTQAWQTVSLSDLRAYQGLQQSGQWGEQSRLLWLHRFEQMPKMPIQQMKLQFSARQALTPEQIANWQHVPLNVSVETLQIEAIARHEWHGLAWIQRVDQEVIPTGLLQSCEWHKREEQEVLIPNTKEGSMRFICRWLVMEITE